MAQRRHAVAAALHAFANRARLLRACLLPACLLPACLLVAGALCTGGCETVTDAGDIPYVEKIVVDGAVTANEPVTGIRFKRTMPVDAVYDADGAALTDVTGTIRTPGGTYPLVHTGNGYYSAPGAIAHENDSCILMAEWHGKHVIGATRVPPVVAFTSSRHMLPESDPHYPIYDSIHIIVRPNDPHAVYSCSIITSYNGGTEYFRILDPSSYGALIKRPMDTAADGTLELMQEDISLSMHPENTWIRLLAFDAPYYDYMESRQHLSDDELFDSPVPVHWTVKGDAIGVFIGRSYISAQFQ